MKGPDDYVAMPDEQRRRLRLQKRFRHYKKQVRPRLSSEELLKYLRDNKIRSCDVLEKVRSSTDPTTNDFRREFGSWRETVRRAFGTQIAPDIDGEYIVKAVLELNLWSVKRFREARKLDPVTVPSWRQVINKWRSYRNLIECARRMYLKGLLEEYRKLIRRLGHIPSLDEIREANLRMDKAIDFYGSKKKLDEFVSMMKG